MSAPSGAPAPAPRAPAPQPPAPAPAGGPSAWWSLAPLLGPLLVLLTGVVTLRLAVTGAYTAYVRVGMFWVLVVAGLLLALLGVCGLWRLRATAGGPDDDAHDDAHDDASGHGHAHSGTPGVAFLLLLPLAVAYLVAPPSLGAFSAARSAGSTLPDERTGYAPLPVGDDGVADVELAETVRRALYDEAATLQGTRVRTTGFVVPADEQGSVLLTRFVIRCCAADGTPAQIDLDLPPGTPALPADQWVEVVMTYDGDGATASGPPRFVAESVRPVGVPDDPYET